MRFRVSRLHTKMRVIQNLGVEPIMPILPNASPAKDGTTSASATNSRGKAVALYDYEVQGVGELAIKEGEELTVVQGEVDGWIKVFTACHLNDLRV